MLCLSILLSLSATKFLSIGFQYTGFNDINARFKEIDARFVALEAKMGQRFKEFEAKLEQRFVKIEIEIATLNTKVDRMLTLMEEQNDRNKLVMDGLINLFNRQGSLEKRVDERFKTLEDAIKGV